MFEKTAKKCCVVTISIFCIIFLFSSVALSYKNPLTVRSSIRKSSSGYSYCVDLIDLSNGSKRDRTCGKVSGRLFDKNFRFWELEAGHKHRATLIINSQPVMPYEFTYQSGKGDATLWFYPKDGKVALLYGE